MDSKKLTLCCIALIIVVASTCSIFVLNQGEETWITVMSNINIHNGDEFKIALDVLKGVELPNKTVEIIIINSNGEKTTLNSTTDNEGIATFIIDGLNPGNYTVDCVFKGSKGYKSVKITTPLEIKEKVAVEKQVKGTFGVCYYCQKQVDGSWGKVICKECEINKANGFKDPIPDNGGWWSEAYICGPNPGDGSKAWMYNNYHYL